MHGGDDQLTAANERLKIVARFLEQLAGAEVKDA